MQVKAEKNIPHWVANDKDYCLVFCEVDGYWIECGHNLPQFSNILLCDYLSILNIQIPDYCQFCRILAPDYRLEYRAYGGRIRIDMKYVD